MSQHDYVIGNASGATVRSDLNNALAAIVSGNSGATAPSTTYAYMFWADTANDLLKQRNAANNDWITILKLSDPGVTYALNADNLSGLASNATARTNLGLGTAAVEDVATGGTGDLLRTDGDGSALTGLSTTDQTARDMAATAMAIADAAGVAGTKGPFYLTDHFNTDSLAVKTNATYDAVNYLYHNPPDTVIGTFAQAQTTTFGLLTSAGRIGGIRFPASVTGWISEAKIEVTTVNTASDFIAYLYTEAVANPGVVIGSASDAVSVSTAGEKTFSWSGTDAAITAGTDYWIVFAPSNTGVSIALSACGDIGGYYSGRNNTITSIGSTPLASNDWRVEITQSRIIPNMTLEPNTATLDTANPTDLMGYFRINPVDAVTYGTDVVIKGTIDGSTWATSDITKVGDYGSDGDEIVRADIDASAQTGSGVRWQITTANSKQVQVLDSIGTVPIY